MDWKDREMTTLGDLMWGMSNCDNPEEAQEFMRLYRAENEYADQNIGYLTGYCGPEEMRRLQELFGVAHPVFGRSVPTPEEALAAGKQAALDA